MGENAFAEDCAEDFGPQAIVNSLEVAEEAFSDLDVDGFRMATDSATARLPCVRQELSRSLSARFHRFVGLRAFVDREQAKAVSAFAAARTIEPDYEFPETFIPSGNPVMNTYLALDVAMDEWEMFTAPSSGSIHLDGRVATRRSTRFPMVYQYFDAGGAVQDSAYVLPDQRLPAYPGSGAALLETTESVATIAEPEAPGDGPHTGLLIGAGAGSVAAVVLYGVAASQLKTYRDVDTEESELQPLRKSINSKVVASMTIATLSAGAGASAFLVARW